VAHAPESDPAACYARNTHGRSLQEVVAAAAAWEPLPPLFAQLDVRSLLQGAAGGSPRCYESMIGGCPGGRRAVGLCGCGATVAAPGPRQEAAGELAGAWCLS
jgi:hypothetical protein